MSEPQLIAEIVNVAVSLSRVHGVPLSAIPRHLLDLSTREQRTLKRAAILIEDGRRCTWHLRVPEMER